MFGRKFELVGKRTEQKHIFQSAVDSGMVKPKAIYTPED